MSTTASEALDKLVNQALAIKAENERLRAAVEDLLSDIDSMDEIPSEISGTALCKARQAISAGQVS